MTIVTLNLTADSDPGRQVADPITELLRAHARTLIQSALEVEVECVLAELRDAGRHVVRNGHLPERQVTTAVGDVTVAVPRIRSRDGQSVNFASTMVPRYLRRSASIDAWAAFAYLRGVSEADLGTNLVDRVAPESSRRNAVKGTRLVESHEGVRAIPVSAGSRLTVHYDDRAIRLR